MFQRKSATLAVCSAIVPGLTLDETILRPGCANDQGFRLTAWRIAEDADEQWGSCFYFLRPRVRTTLRILQANWYEQELSVYGVLGLDTDQTVQLTDQLPLRVRVRLEVVDAKGARSQWVNVNVQPSGGFMVTRADVKGLVPAEVRVQAGFDRTNLLASARSGVFVCNHEVAPVIL